MSPEPALISREMAGAVFALASGCLVWIACRLPFRAPRREASPETSAQVAERTSFRRLVLPMLPMAAAIFFLIGWAHTEPEQSDEIPPLSLTLAALLYGPVVVRAGIRAVRSALVRPEVSTAAAVGILRPRVVVSSEFLAGLDDEERDAVLAHEAAHVAGHDPLRLWIGQVIADLQWPLRAPALHLANWRHALGIARDEDARRAGSDGAALAAAVLKAAGYDAARSTSLAAIEGPGGALRDRVERLLAPVPTWTPPSKRLRIAWLASAALFVSLGSTVGDSIAEWLCGNLP
ncbi:M56 family metallopeptidase [Vulgatibacter incomptus]|nr:M56 family metallopeptidase [Vulgatibacter incomptus]